MPRLRIILLDQDDSHTYRYALWADVPLARQSQYASVGAVSVWKGALAEDLAALAAGQMTEVVETIGLSSGTTDPQVRAELQARWKVFQDRIAAKNSWARYGTTWDGTTWSAKGVA